MPCTANCLNIACSVNDCAVVQYSSVVCAVYIAYILTVRALASIAQVYTHRTLHCAIIHATRNVQTEGKFAIILYSTLLHSTVHLTTMACSADYHTLLDHSMHVVMPVARWL